LKIKMFVAILLCLGGAAIEVPGAEQSVGGDDTDAFVAREKIRADVESILAELNRPGARRDDPRIFYNATERLAALGPPVVDYLAAELDQPSVATYNIAAYALGLVGTPEAATALKRAIARADDQRAKFNAAQKVWSVYGLAVLGDAEAVALLESGPNRIGHEEFMNELNLLQAVSVLTAPESVPILVELLAIYSKDQDSLRQLWEVLDSLALVAQPSVREHVVPFLDHEDWRVRRGAIHALTGLRDPATDADRLIAALSDPEERVARAAAEGLAALQPAGHVKQILAALENEQRTSVRLYLYVALASILGEEAIDPLATYWGRPNYLDRLWIADAVGKIGDPKGVNLLRVALRDPDLGVVIRAMDSLRRIDTPGARDALLAQLRDQRWPVANAAIGALVRLDETRAAPRLADRLLRSELGDTPTDHTHRDHIRALGDALVALRYTAPIQDLRTAAAVQTDPLIVEYLASLDKLLTETKRRGDDVAKWIEAAASADPEIRRLAYRRLGASRTSEGARALVSRFDEADDDERLDILRALAVAGSGEAAPLLSRVLLDAEFDAHDQRHVRSVAAWAARNVGGEAMTDALRRSAERREGRDLNVLVCLALLAGEEALPTLKAYRGKRLRYFEWDRGVEQKDLDRIIADLSGGRSIAFFDKPPKTER
jgi:HEAT repeat protein